MIKTKILFFIYFSFFFFLIFEILFSEKNIFRFFNNFDEIQKYQIILEEKKNKFFLLESYLYNFENFEEFKKIIIKDKLFFKDKDEKILLY